MNSPAKADVKSVKEAKGKFDFEAEGDAAVAADESSGFKYFRSLSWMTLSVPHIECKIEVAKAIDGVVAVPSVVSEYKVSITLDAKMIMGLGNDDKEAQQKLLDMLAEEDPSLKSQNPKVI